MKQKTNSSYAPPANPGRIHFCLTTVTRSARICIAITEKPVRHMNRLKIRTEEMTVIAAIISFIAGATEGLGNHNFTESIDAQIGNSRFYVAEPCDKCG